MKLILNQLTPVPLNQNPYKFGEPIEPRRPTAIARNLTTASGVPITVETAINLAVACGASVSSESRSLRLICQNPS